MQSRSESSASFAAAGAQLAALFVNATAAGRDVLNQQELTSLLSSGPIPLVTEPQLPNLVPFGELQICLNNTREFGLVISAGSGGLDRELDAGNFKWGRVAVHAVVELTDAHDFLTQFKRTLAYQKLTITANRRAHAVPDEQLTQCFKFLLELAGTSAPSIPGSRHTLTGLTLNVEQDDDRLVVRGAECTFGIQQAARLGRPIHKIDKLIHPGSIGIIGVSASNMNFGRIILHNLLGSGYSKDKLTIIRAGETEIDGVRCVESLKALSGKLDLLIVAVAASAVYELVDEIIDTDAVESVMLIPGGLGETQKSKEPAAGLADRINANHCRPGGGPIFLGANCLGVVSHPGSYDSWFIPLERLPKPPKKPQRNSVMLSQSGAFMITRLSQNPWLDPRYMLALGNQTDLTHGDLLRFFAEQPEIDTIGIYIEGFKDRDGLDFAIAVRAAVKNGKQVVVYKSGKTSPGASSVMGHTASIAGDTALFVSVLRQAGAMVAEDISTFDDLFYIAGALHHKTVGKRLGAISGAGFESVGIADSIDSDNFSMEMGTLEPATIRRVEDILIAKKLQALVEVRNPIDINPGADDETHLQITEAFVQDPNIDAVVVGLDPTAPSVRALVESTLRPGFDIQDPKSTVYLMPPIVLRNGKPIIGIIDGGSLYDAMAAKLMDQGVCIFRNCARGTKALVRYIEVRMYADNINHRNR